jgi:hypothetical protein
MHLAHCIAVAVCLLSGSIADARPDRPDRDRKAKKTKKKKQVPKKVVVPVDDRAGEDDIETTSTARLAGKPDDEDEEDEETDDDKPNDEVAVLDEDTDVVDVPVKVRKKAERKEAWNLAIGPYLWASAVEADVSLGSSSASAGVDFIDIQRHAKFGIELLGELRFGRVSVTGDFMYGVIGIDGEREVGPLMVTLNGDAGSLLAEGVAGFRLAGDERSLFAIEARAGVRYQRTSISGAVIVDGETVAAPSQVDAAADGIAGARAFLRPFRRFHLSGAADVLVAGQSAKTWSATADASYQIGSRVLVSLGWRTLTTERASVSLKMYGPRLAVQLLF